MSTFTCINCSVKFATAEMQREHYRTDWHRYNLKRRVAELPPITAEDFQLKVLQIRNIENAAKEEKESCLYCTPCRRQFSNTKAHENHLKSRKHLELEQIFKQSNNEHDNITIKSPITIKEHPALKAAVQGKGKYNFIKQQVQQVEKEENCETNMSTDDDDDATDYEIIEEEEILGDVGDGDGYDDDLMNEGLPENPLTIRHCLFCPNYAEDVMDNLKHMSMKHSFFIPDTEYCVDVEGLLNYLSEKVAIYFMCLWCNDRGKTFYSLDAVRKHMMDKGHCQMLHEGLALAEYSDYYDYSTSYPDHKDSMDVDEEITPDLLEGDEYQLVLPSGAIIGHRSLLRYYKQHLNPNRAATPKKSNRHLHQLLSTYRSLGWTQTQQKAAARKARDIHVMKRAQAKWQMKLSCKANKLQHHYREQVLV